VAALRSSPHDLNLESAADTDRLGRALCRACEGHAAAIAAQGLQVRMYGDLGSGKTSLVRGWLRAWGVTGPIRSPTFAVLEPYVVFVPQARTAGLPGVEAQNNSSLNFYHFDFYRFADPAEFSIGFRELFGPASICAIEWPEKAGDRLPPADLSIHLAVERDGRRATLSAASELGQACLESTVREFETAAS
jgi:tRNA threonylcarbamoyladenosine biosynthesis protein TsaE